VPGSVVVLLPWYTARLSAVWMCEARSRMAPFCASTNTVSSTGRVADSPVTRTSCAKRSAPLTSSRT
jgi:hypothetical protein